MSKKLVIIIINFVVVLVVTFLLINQIKVYQGLHDVYVAKEMIEQGEKITPEMIELKKVTLNHEGKNSKLVSYYDDVITEENLGFLGGKYAAYDIIPGEILIQSKFTEETDNSKDYMHKLPKGYYAYVIKNGVAGGIIEVGDYIDIYIYDEEQKITIEEPVLRHLKIYDLRDKNGNSTEAISENAEDLPAEYIVLALNDFQLKKIMYYQNTEATIRMALRSRGVETYDYLEILYPDYAIEYDEDIVNEEREKEILEQIKAQEESKKLFGEEEQEDEQGKDQVADNVEENQNEVVESPVGEVVEEQTTDNTTDNTTEQ